MHNWWKHHSANVPTNWLISKLMPDFLSSVQLRLQDSDFTREGSKLNKRQGPILSERSSKPRTEISTVIGVVCFSQRFIIYCLENQFNVCIKEKTPIQKCSSQRNVNILQTLVLKRCRSFQLPFECVLLTMIFPSKKKHHLSATISGIRPWGSLGFGEGSCWEEGMVTKKKLQIWVVPKNRSTSPKFNMAPGK